MSTPLWNVELIIQVGDHGTPGSFRARIPAPSPMHAWAGALRKLHAHAQRQGWGSDNYRVLSYRHFHKITNESEDS